MPHQRLGLRDHRDVAGGHLRHLPAGPFAHTLAHRVANLIRHGADPQRMLLLTFSRRAAQEMERRVGGVLQQALGLTVFLITHDLDTLYATCDRVAVLSQKKVLTIGPIEEVERTDDPWIKDYFHGPRARAAKAAMAMGS